MHFMEEEFARDRVQREHDRALENLLEATRVHVTGQENGRRNEFRRRAGNMRLVGLDFRKTAPKNAYIA